MAYELPGAIPEIPVEDLGAALAYYTHQLGFTHDWGGESGGGIAGISQGSCRLFLADRAFRERRYGNAAPVLVWLGVEITMARRGQLKWWQIGHMPLIAVHIRERRLPPVGAHTHGIVHRHMQTLAFWRPCPA